MDRKSFTLLFLSQYQLTYRTANTNRCKELVYITRCWIFGYKTVQWKFIEHSDLVRFGIKHKLIRDLLSSNYRKSHYEKWFEYPQYIAKSKGFVFSENTPPNALGEIFSDGIYDVKGFTPEPNVVIDIGAPILD